MRCVMCYVLKPQCKSTLRRSKVPYIGLGYFTKIHDVEKVKLPEMRECFLQLQVEQNKQIKPVDRIPCKKLKLSFTFDLSSLHMGVSNYIYTSVDEMWQIDTSS